MRAMFIYTLHSFLFEFYPIDIYIYIYHVETMRISSGYAHFRNDSNSPRLHRIFPAETEVDNARITLPFSTFFSRIINSSTGRRGSAHILSLSLSLPDLERKTLRVTRLRQFSRESDQRRNQKKDEFSRTSGKCRAGYFILFQSNSIEKTKRRVLFGGEIFQISQSSVLTNEQIIVQVSLQTLSSPLSRLYLYL